MVSSVVRATVPTLPFFPLKQYPKVSSKEQCVLGELSELIVTEKCQANLGKTSLNKIEQVSFGGLFRILTIFMCIVNFQNGNRLHTVTQTYFFQPKFTFFKNLL